MNINLEYYKIFYYVSKTGGITSAAEALSVSQPAVSQAIKQLESELGTTLFVRTPKGVSHTIAGEQLFSYVEQGYETIKNGENKLMEMMNLEAGELRIGASDMTLQFYLLPFLQSFHEKYPKIKIQVTNAPTPETLRFLQNGKIDFGVVSSPVSSKHEFQITKVREIEDIYVAGEKFRDLQGRILSYEKLKELPLISLEGNTSTRRYVENFLKKHGVSVNSEIELATSDMLVQFALRNLGVASVVKDFALPYLESGELFQLEFEEAIPKRSFCIVSEGRNKMSTAAQKLMSLMIL